MDDRSGDSREERTYPLGAASRLTGLSPDLLRAWERRYGVVQPIRTPGGTRRYRASDLERLRAVKSAVDAGYRISEVAALDDEELARRVEPAVEETGDPIPMVMQALARLDGEEAERIIAFQLAALGPVRFAQRFAVPLLNEVGRAWAGGQVCVASEHLASSLLRSLLGASLRALPASAQASPILFTTLPGERHELGLLIAALTAVGCGGRSVYLGPDLPIDEIVAAAATTGAGAVAISVVSMEANRARGLVAALRLALSDDIELWLGGKGSSAVDAPPGVDVLGSLDAIEAKVGMLDTPLVGGRR